MLAGHLEVGLVLLDRCDDGVHRLLGVAQNVAREHRQAHVETAAVLVALARHQGPRLHAALDRLGTPATELASRALRRMAELPAEAPPSGELPTSVYVSRVTELALPRPCTRGRPWSASAEPSTAGCPARPSGHGQLPRPAMSRASLVQTTCFLCTRATEVAMTLVSVHDLSGTITTETAMRALPDLASAVESLTQRRAQPLVLILDDVTVSLPALRRLAQAPPSAHGKRSLLGIACASSARHGRRVAERRRFAMK